MKIQQTVAVAVMALMLTLACPMTYAQEKGSDGWEFSLAPYLWAVGLDGDITVKGTSQSVDVDFDELLDEVDYAVQLHFEAKKRDWSLIVDPKTKTFSFLPSRVLDLCQAKDENCHLYCPAVAAGCTKNDEDINKATHMVQRKILESSLDRNGNVSRE